MKLPFIFISRKKYLQNRAEADVIEVLHQKSLDELSEEITRIKENLSLSEQQAVSEIEKLRKENKELKEKLLTAVFGNQEYEKQFAELKSQLTEVQKPLMQDDKDRQIKNLKLKIEAKEREIAEQKNITHFKNQIINGLKGYTAPRKDLEEKYPS